LGPGHHDQLEIHVQLLKSRRQTHDAETHRTRYQHGVRCRADGEPWTDQLPASKGGQIAFTKSLAREVAARNITVNAIAPGFVDTEILDAMPPETLEAALKLVPLARKGKPEEIAYAVAFLASDQAAFITGQILGVDGGMAMM